MADVLSRSFSMPSVGTDGLNMDGSLEVKMVESREGLLRCRVSIPTQDEHHYKWNQAHLKDLTNPIFSASTITSSLSKTLRRNGCLMPLYGITVNMKRGRQPSLSTLPPLGHIARQDSS